MISDQSIINNKIFVIIIVVVAIIRITQINLDICLLSAAFPPSAWRTQTPQSPAWTRSLLWEFYNEDADGDSDDHGDDDGGGFDGVGDDESEIAIVAQEGHYW